MLFVCTFVYMCVGVCDYTHTLLVKLRVVMVVVSKLSIVTIVMMMTDDDDE